jgi:small subunit ribosomal protein S1
MEKETNSITQGESFEPENEDSKPADEQVTSNQGTTSGASETAEDVQDTDSFMELYEESLKSIQEGEVIKGEIVQVDKEYVLVDIGYKSEGQIAVREFLDSEGNLTANVGDRVEVLLERREDDEGTIRLSKEKAAKIKIWDDIKRIYENNGTIKGKVLSRVKGGLSVDIGLQAFLPGSQVDLRPVRDMDALVGTEHEFKIVKGAGILYCPVGQF